MKINNISILRQRRKDLRNNLTAAEAMLWKLLKRGSLGKKFRRQHSVGPYILDFYCATVKLVIELDGQHHFTSAGLSHDENRTQYLMQFGIRVLRFENEAKAMSFPASSKRG